MAVDIQALVMDQLDPVVALDTTIAAAVTRRIDAEILMLGWNVGSLADPQAVYISVRTLKSMVPRLLLKFAQELKRTKAGTKAEAEWQDAVKFLSALMTELTQELAIAGAQVGIALTDTPAGSVAVGSPSTGFKAFK